MWNLVLVCSRHHTLIHADGYQLVLSPDRTLTVRTAGDIPVPRTPAVVTGNQQELPFTGKPYTCGWQGDPLDFGYVVMVMAQHTR